MAKAKSEKLTLKHIIGYGAGDCGGCFGLYMVSGYMEIGRASCRERV